MASVRELYTFFMKRRTPNRLLNAFILVAANTRLSKPTEYILAVTFLLPGDFVSL
jgi:hypothetical protein